MTSKERTLFLNAMQSLLAYTQTRRPAILQRTINLLVELAPPDDSAILHNIFPKNEKEWTHESENAHLDH